MTKLKNANDVLQGFIGTEQYYKTLLPHIVYTDGAQALFEQFQCYWLMDIVVSYQIEKKFREEEFQTWKLTVKEDASWIVKADDGNGNVLVTQKGEYTDFSAESAELWLSHGVIMLPSEY
jgi:hypothetical protein